MLEAFAGGMYRRNQIGLGTAPSACAAAAGALGGRMSGYYPNAKRGGASTCESGRN